MKLKDYLAEQGLTHQAFAARIGVTTTAVQRYANGHRIPRRAIMRQITKATAGAVIAADFYAQDPEGEAA